MNTLELTSRFAGWLGEVTGDRRITYLPDVPISAQAAMALGLMARTGRTVLWITDGPPALQSAHSDVLTLAPPGT